MPTLGQLHVGCSGWQYPHWRGDFYPEGLPHDQWLSHYARTFDTVEINNSFYKLPEPEVVLSWRERAPKKFLFAWKASRFLTHMKKLKAPAEPVHRMMERAQLLDGALGPILFQLPPHWGRNVDRLEELFRVLPKDRRYAVELRDPSWYDDAVYDALDRAHVALCLHDMPGSVTPLRSGVFTQPFVYLRFHGADAKYTSSGVSAARYTGGYPRNVLDGWASRLFGAIEGGHDVYAYFNNDADGHAPRDALTLRDAIAALR